MQTLLRASMLLCFSLYCVDACAQQSNELPPLVSEETAFADVIVDTSNSFQWTPAFLAESSSGFSEYLRRGHVYSSVDFAALSTSDQTFQTDGDFVITPRIQLGWESESGFGVRGGYWNYGNTVSYPIYDRTIDTTLVPDFTSDGEPIPQQATFVNPNDGKTFKLTAENFQFDFYQRFMAGKTEISVGGGLQSATWSKAISANDAITFSGNLLSTVHIYENKLVKGVGPSLFADVNRPILERGSLALATYLGGRTSFLFAEYDLYEHYAFSPSFSSIDDDLWINEGHVGLELVNRHRYLTSRLRGQFETQYWNSSVTDDQAFTGASLSFGVDW